MTFWKANKKQKNSLWNIPLNARKPFKDSDKDKVIDIFDCQPRNRKKQGVFHKKDKWEELDEYVEDSKKRFAKAKKHWEKAKGYGMTVEDAKYLEED